MGEGALYTTVLFVFLFFNSAKSTPNIPASINVVTLDVDERQSDDDDGDVSATCQLQPQIVQTNEVQSRDADCRTHVSDT